jgi:hypothetical protein
MNLHAGYDSSSVHAKIHFLSDVYGISEHCLTFPASAIGVGRVSGQGVMMVGFCGHPRVHAVLSGVGR